MISACYRVAMRLSVFTVANAAAWAVLLGLIAVAFVMVVILGPFGLILLGLLTVFVCTSASLREDNPTWGPEVFKSRLGGHSSPEQRAAQAAETGQTLIPLRFYRWCGVALLVAGIASFAWQQSH
jgi:hypothetical protein